MKKYDYRWLLIHPKQWYDYDKSKYDWSTITLDSAWGGYKDKNQTICIKKIDFFGSAHEYDFDKAGNIRYKKTNRIAVRKSTIDNLVVAHILKYSR